MRRGSALLFFMLCFKLLFAQNEVGPEGHKLFWILLVLLVVGVIFAVSAKPKRNTKAKKRNSFFSIRKLRIKLEKDALYYPDKLTLTVENTGNTDVDLDQPLLVFDNFWLKRKFKIKGMDNRSLYPLFLEKGKSHALEIDLNRFYRHDKRLKRFPKAKVLLSDVKGKKLGSSSTFLRKTLFRF